jgi:hypothetical protein
LRGGSLKNDQFLSGSMADIFSNIYLAYSVIWFENNNNISLRLKDYCVQRLLNENQFIINKIISNSKLYEKIFIFHLKKSIDYDNYKTNLLIIDEIISNDKIVNSLKNDIFIKKGILEDLEELNNLDKYSEEYKELYNKVIQVGEYTI